MLNRLSKLGAATDKMGGLSEKITSAKSALFKKDDKGEEDFDFTKYIIPNENHNGENALADKGKTPDVVNFDDIKGANFDKESDIIKTDIIEKEDKPVFLRSYVKNRSASKRAMQEEVSGLEENNSDEKSENILDTLRVAETLEVSKPVENIETLEVFDVADEEENVDVVFQSIKALNINEQSEPAFEAEDGELYTPPLLVGFDDNTDYIEVEYMTIEDPDSGFSVVPTIMVKPSSDGQSGEIYLNGRIVASIAGASDIKKSDIKLVKMAA